MRLRLHLLASAAACCASCGLSGSPTGTSTSAPGAAVITIQDFGYSPDNLEVAPGDTVTVKNMDTSPHSVTSQSAPGRFVSGAVNGVAFDTGAFSAGERTFTIPSSAPHGTVIPYYCTVHLGGMRNAAQLTLR